MLAAAFLTPPAVLLAAWLIKAVGARSKQEQEGSMLSSLGIAVVICFLVGTAIVVALAVGAGTRRSGDSIGRVLYDAEHPEKTR